MHRAAFLAAEARLAAALDLREEAARAYGLYKSWLADAEPELQPELDRVREELAHLAGERPGGPAAPGS